MDDNILPESDQDSVNYNLYESVKGSEYDQDQDQDQNQNQDQYKNKYNGQDIDEFLEYIKTYFPEKIKDCNFEDYDINDPEFMKYFYDLVKIVSTKLDEDIRMKKSVQELTGKMLRKNTPEEVKNVARNYAFMDTLTHRPNPTPYSTGYVNKVFKPGVPLYNPYPYYPYPPTYSPGIVNDPVEHKVSFNNFGSIKKEKTKRKTITKTKSKRNTITKTKNKSPKISIKSKSKSKANKQMKTIIIKIKK